MELRLLEYFVAVCEELHVTKASEKLGISQPTLSHQIRLLEHRMGTPLFQRIGKKIYITEAGHILYKHSQNVFHELEQAKAAINEIRGMQRGSLRIGCSGNHLLTAAMLAFHERYPNIELSVTELATEETQEGLLHNRLDLGVVFLPTQDELLDSIPLYNEQLELVVSATHKLAGVPSIELRDLADIPLGMLQKKFYVRQMIDHYSEEVGVPLRPIVEMSTLDSLLQMAKISMGGAILPRSYLMAVKSSDIKAIPIINPTPQQEVGIVFRKDMYRCTTTDTFIQELLKHF
ncbi:LysR family transcriptional regulator [Paenibacillus hexagrammi]|uniref:LysR substrate-binding domain-containing protein n=1 Tax=Paenibacillus hexagrammi TaxID=2908839 RepID=A0ABY3SGA5_9BACL|nr:LysR substrate-binding domain-containing protein [Paenibacillus sp. YPD9-1]UJF32951.1 LysR substrate-binding domain-containing protein [Paenibacillus sp. YPD9-1]